jgi:class 3 adenylate cyclase
MRLQALAENFRDKAREALLRGDAEQAVQLASQAQECVTSTAGRRLLILAVWARYSEKQAETESAENG